MAELVKSDLVFILQQIEIAEANAAGQPLSTLIPNSALPYGLRTVDGSDNNLFMDQTDFGAADVIFPRLTTPGVSPGGGRHLVHPDERPRRRLAAACHL